MKKLLAMLAALFAIALVPTSAHAYSYKTCLGERIKFDSNSRTIRPSTVSFPAGYWETGIRDTINKFNTNPSNFRYSPTTMDSGGVGRNNGQNEIWGGSGSILSGAPAVAYQFWTCYWLFGDHVHMDEVDVIFDYASPFRWTADTVKSSLIRYTGTKRALQTTGAHELGHGLILNHVNTEYNIMGSDFEHIHVNGSTATAYTGEDAADGAVFLYGVRSTWSDLGVVHWKYSGPSGEYSDHEKTVVYNTTGSVLPTVDVNGELGYRVGRGQTVRAEFTYENNGASTRNGIAVGYYISTNDLITTGDRKIGSASFTLARDNVLTTSIDVRIPSDLLAGTNYWLGVIIDDTNAILENVESNNATYTPIRTN
jgi:hypothetical protein